MGSLSALQLADGPREEWHVVGDEVAFAGNTPFLIACVEMDVHLQYLQWPLQGIRFETSGCPRFAVSDDYSSATENLSDLRPRGGNMRAGPLSGLSKITRYPEGDVSSDLSALRLD